MTFLNDKVVEIYPQKYWGFIYFHNDQHRDERDAKVKKRALVMVNFIVNIHFLTR